MHPTLRKPTLLITVDQAVHRVEFGKLTAIDAAAFRAATGMSLRAVTDEFDATGGLDLDQIAALIWLSARAAKPDLTYPEVAAALTYDNQVALVLQPYQPPASDDADRQPPASDDADRQPAAAQA